VVVTIFDRDHKQKSVRDVRGLGRDSTNVPLPTDAGRWNSALLRADDCCFGSSACDVPSALAPATSRNSCCDAYDRSPEASIVNALGIVDIHNP
jgi:hypothetical protein